MGSKFADQTVAHGSSPGISPDRNFSYAVQWWSFALLALAMFVGLNLKRTHV